ncbi:MAG: hypothetical protein ISR00_02210 [Flavobacteriales bacterium]|nr:hypothetical protein [Flavobacteriales bacterium]MBL6872746.1 hypothetical protein [Flavobacteriales bacterium]
MNTSKRLIRISLGLGIITLIALFFSVLALTDIYHNNESNLKMEWNIIRVSYLFTIIFVVISSITIWRVSKKLKTKI